ncbi:MAG: hypothetical protein IJX30_06175 [Clostridia bacterium]|nr:hypothetical protein [Clostridia bacterium]
MKILFISQSPINASVSIGNTFLNIFDGFENMEFGCLYTKSGLPDSRIQDAFRINEKMIIYALLGKAVGERVNARYSGEQVIEGKTVGFAKRKRWTIFFWLQNLIWRLPFWKSKRLKNFLDDYNPDIIFTVLSDSVPLNRIIRFVQSYTKKPLALYAWDDNYSVKTSGVSPLKKINRLISRSSMRKTVKKASQFYVISQIQKKEYEYWFQRDCKVLTKSEDFSMEPCFKENFGKPLRLVFTGNIGMNRWKSLGMIARALQRINTDEIKAQLYIYSGNTPTEEIKEALQIGKSSFFMGSIPADEVADLQNKADILVHVEGLDKKSQKEVHQSFSTKLVDYFKAARPILAVGPKNVASIEHLRENNCALLAETEEELIERLLVAINDHDKLQLLAKNAYECGKNNHDATVMKKMLEMDIQQLYKGNE